MRWEGLAATRAEDMAVTMVAVEKTVVAGAGKRVVWRVVA